MTSAVNTGAMFAALKMDLLLFGLIRLFPYLFAFTGNREPENEEMTSPLAERVIAGPSTDVTMLSATLSMAKKREDERAKKSDC